MYITEGRSVTPDMSDNVSESGSVAENNTVKANKVTSTHSGLFYLCKRSYI